ncbi:hypothetical protein [Streptomyces sp. NBC_01768]|uniref:hypothetical protein n=1 Tax=Streptomyces sp. NBC_01768 TaxID=2975938 RepID=UPI002DD8E224|nr:hypothetical protein [Streptomyces sp. NBC_01768]WSC31808.1 hypothetical protein OG902_36745 [Streptomyces sp. NBC_01768]
MSKDKVLEAVDALAVELGIGKDGLAFTWDQLERINGILDAHAHELAEKIRNVDQRLMVGYRDRDVLADLIDPEVEAATPRDIVFNCQTIGLGE